AEQDLGFPPRQVEQVIVVLDQAKPEPATSPKKEEPKDSWVLVDSKEGRFSVRFPQPPETKERNTFIGKRHIFLAELEKGAYEYEVSYFDFSPDFAGASPESRLDTAVRGLEFKTGYKGKKEIRLDKFPGAEVEIDDKQLRTFAVHRVYVVGNRGY